MYQNKEDYKSAIEAFEKANELNPKNFEIVFGLAKSYHGDKQYEKAISYYDKLLEKDKQNTDLLYNKALACHALGSYEKAITIYKTLLSQKDDEKIKEYLSDAYNSLGQEYYAEEQFRCLLAPFR